MIRPALFEVLAVLSKADIRPIIEVCEQHVFGAGHAMQVVRIIQPAQVHSEDWYPFPRTEKH
jgi:hypothetical protein